MDLDLGAPASWLVAAAGQDVLAADGTRVGVLRHVLAVEDEDLFEGLVIEAHGIRVVAPELVDEFYERGVVLTIPPEEVAGLPEPAPAPGALEAHGDEPPPGPMHRRLHRAWELISGGE